MKFLVFTPDKTASKNLNEKERRQFKNEEFESSEAVILLRLLLEESHFVFQWNHWWGTFKMSILDLFLIYYVRKIFSQISGSPTIWEYRYNILFKKMIPVGEYPTSTNFLFFMSITVNKVLKLIYATFYNLCISSFIIFMSTQRYIYLSQVLIDKVFWNCN